MRHPEGATGTRVGGRYAAHHMAIAQAMVDRHETRVRTQLREHLAAVRDLVLEAFPS